MKKIFTRMRLLCLALTVLMLASCKGGNDYRNMIPSDAFMVASANPKSLIHKAQVGDFTQSPIYREIEKAMTEDGDMTPEAREYVLSLMADPAKTGLSMDHDMFVFMNGGDFTGGDFQFGLVAKVANRGEVDKLAGFIMEQEDNDMTLTEEGGLSILSDPEETSETMALAYNGDALVIYVSDEDTAVGMPALKAMFTRKKENSIMNNPHVASVYGGSNDASILMSYGSMMPMIEQQMGGTGMAGMEFLSHMSILAPVNFEKGRILSDARVFFDDKEAEKQFMDLSTANMTLRRDVLKYIPQGSIAAFAGGMNGAKTYELLQKMPMYAMALSMVPQAKTILEAVEGDVMLSFNKMSADGRLPLATIMAELSDPAVIESIKELLGMAGIAATEVAPGKFEGAMMGVPFSYGVHDGLFYASTDPGFTTLMNEGGAAMHDKYGHLASGGRYGAFVIDFVALRSMLEMLVAEQVIPSEVGMALPFIGIFEDVHASNNSLTDMNMTVNMTDKEKNSADVLFHTIENLVTMMVAMQ